METPLNDQVALITGAGQGVGQGIAYALAKRGVRVIAVGRTLEKCAATVAAIQSRFGTDATALHCDIAATDTLDALVDEAVAQYGRLDILVNNGLEGIPTGTNKKLDIESTTFEAFAQHQVGQLAARFVRCE